MFEFQELPAKDMRITSKYGPRNTGIAGASTYHKGIDIGPDRKQTVTPVYAVADGTIILNRFKGVRGHTVMIRHDETYVTLYQHLRDQAPFRVGEKIRAGQCIGVMGNTSSTLKIAVHLHFEVQEDHKPIDPMIFVNRYKEDVLRTMTEAELRRIIREELGGKDKPVSDWAKDAWDKAEKEGTMDGTNPKGYVTREQLAVVLGRLKED